MRMMQGVQQDCSGKLFQMGVVETEDEAIKLLANAVGNRPGPVTDIKGAEIDVGTVMRCEYEPKTKVEWVPGSLEHRTDYFLITEIDGTTRRL